MSREASEQANTRSKALILVKDRPMMDYVLYNAKMAGITRVFIVIGEQGALFKSYYGEAQKDNIFNGLSISYAVQHIPKNRIKPMGTADAVFQTLEQFPELQKDSFLVCNCDNLYSKQAIFALRESATRNAFINYDRAALEYPMDRIARFALTKVDEENYLQAIIEKPSPEEQESYRNADGSFRVSMNIFKFDGTLFFHYLKNCPMHLQRKEKELPTAIINMIGDFTKAMKAIPLSEHVPDLTQKSDISVMNDYLTSQFKTMNWNK